MNRRAVVTGVANKFSIAWAIAEKLKSQGYQICFTFPDERIGEKVKRLTEDWEGTLYHKLDVSSDEDFENFKTQLGSEWEDGIDAVVHSIAFAKREELSGEFLNTSREGFRLALDISAYSLVALVRSTVELLEKRKGSVITLTYLGGEKVVPNYNVMGVAKAALESCVRYLASDLGPRGMRINAVSPGPIKTAAARGISGFDQMLKFFTERSPLRRTVSQEEVAEVAEFLLSDRASGINGQVVYVDGGYSVMGM